MFLLPGHKYDAKEVVVDPEFGAFGDNGCIDFIKSEFDVQLDKASLLPGSFTFEKYFAGKYIGELLRLILVKLHNEGLLFEGNKSSSHRLGDKDSISSADLSLIEEDTVAEKVENTRRIIEESLKITCCSNDDIRILQHVCELLTHRCALLVAIPLACFIRRMCKVRSLHMFL